MQINSLIKFTDSAQEEVSVLMREMDFAGVADMLSKSNSLPAEYAEKIQSMFLTVADMFDGGLPALGDNPLETLRQASRDFNMSRLLKERGLARVYRLLNTVTEVPDPVTGEIDLVPMFSMLTDPETNEPFARREDFIIWFCTNAHAPRSLLFQRMSTYDRLLSLGFSLEDSYNIILRKPSAIRKVLLLMGDWHRGDLVDVAPNVARRLTEKFAPDKADEIESVIQRVDDASAENNVSAEEDAHGKYLELVKPLIAQAVEEVSNHQSTRDAVDFVQHDLAGQPEIRYRWNFEKDWLEVEVTRKSIDPNGREFISDILVVPFIPDIPVVPQEVLEDLFSRLPLRNREGR
jgi:hypothetical protein